MSYLGTLSFQNLLKPALKIGEWHEGLLTKKLFVYGTLKRGFPLGSCLFDSSFLGTGSLKGLVMYNLGEYPGLYRKTPQNLQSQVPGSGDLLVQPETDTEVFGEVFEVSDKTLCFLDQVEGMQFTRRLWDSPEWGSVHVYMATLEPVGAKIIEGGVWTK